MVSGIPLSLTDSWEDRALVRSPHLALTWEDNEYVVTEPREGRKFKIPSIGLEILRLADTPITVQGLANEAAVDSSLIETLLQVGLLMNASNRFDANYWSTFDLLSYAESFQSVPRATSDARISSTSACNSIDESACSISDSVELQGKDFWHVLASRRSSRRFSEDPLDKACLRQFLRRSAQVQRSDGKTSASWRPYPSGGGRHPLEIYILAMGVSGLSKAAYRYDPYRDVLILVRDDAEAIYNSYAQLRPYIGATDTDHPPAAALLITAVFERTMSTYSHGVSLIYKDTGAMLQTFYLVATALGLGGVAVGGGYGAEQARTLGLDPIREGPVGCFLLGKDADGE